MKNCIVCKGKGRNRFENTDPESIFKYIYIDCEECNGTGKIEEKEAVYFGKDILYSKNEKWGPL